jgi:hypothetical protein
MRMGAGERIGVVPLSYLKPQVSSLWPVCGVRGVAVSARLVVSQKVTVRLRSDTLRGGVRLETRGLRKSALRSQRGEEAGENPGGFVGLARKFRGDFR